MDGLASIKKNSSCPNDEILETILNLQQDDELTLQVRSHLGTCTRCQQRLDQLTSAPILKNMQLHEAGELEDSHRKLVSNIARQFSQKLDDQKQEQAHLAETQFGAADTEVSLNELKVDLPPEGAIDDLPKTIGRYSVLKELGRGGAGVVYLAFDPEINRKIAIKRIHSARSSQKSRLIREAKAAAQLQIDQVVRIYSIETDDDSNPFITMEFVEGQTLLDEIKQSRYLSTERAVKICSEIATAVQAAHDLGMLHRDIKPGNVLLDKNGNAKLADFGLAHLGESAPQLTKTGVLLGTPAYMSPEQAAGESLDGRSDIYSLGCVLYESLTGSVPFYGTTHQVLRQIAEDPPVSMLKLNENTPKSLHLICSMAMAKRPESRYQSANDFHQDLTAAINGDAIMARPESSLERAVRWYNKNTRVAWLSGAVAALLMVTTIVSLVSARRIAGESQKAIQASDESKRLAVEAAEQRTLAVETLNELVIGIQNELKGKPGTIEIKRSILKIALEGLKKVVPEGQTLEVNHANATAYLRMADIELSRGNDKASEQYYEKAKEIAEKICEQFPDEINGKIDLSTALLGLADLKLVQYQYDDALNRLNNVLEIRKSIVDIDPSIEYQFDYARVMGRIGGALASLQRFEESAQSFEKAVEIMGKFQQQIDQDIRFTRSFVVAKSGLASQFVYTKQYDRAIPLLSEISEINERLLKSDPKNSDYMLDAAVASGQMAQIHIQNIEWDQAIEYAVKARQQYEKLVETNPSNDWSRSNLALWWSTEAQIRRALEDLDGAELAWNSGYDLLDGVLQNNPDVIRFIMPAAEIAVQLAGIQERRSDLEAALGYAQQAKEWLKNVPEEMKSVPAFQPAIALGFALPDALELVQKYLDNTMTAPTVTNDTEKFAAAILAHQYVVAEDFDRALETADNFSDYAEFQNPIFNQASDFLLAATYSKLVEMEKPSEEANGKLEYLISRSIEYLDNYVVNYNLMLNVLGEPEFKALHESPQFENAVERWKQLK